MYMLFNSNEVGKIAKSDYYLRHVCPSVWNDSVTTGRIFMKFYEYFSKIFHER